MVLRTLTINLIILTLCELVFLHYVKQLVEDENVQLRQVNLEAKNSHQIRLNCTLTSSSIL